MKLHVFTYIDGVQLKNGFGFICGGLGFASRPDTSREAWIKEKKLLCLLFYKKKKA
jgi:hypothetical protein